MASSRLDILINAKANTAPIKSATSELQNLDKAAGAASKGVSGLAVAGGVAGILALGTAAVGTAFDMARISAQALDVEASFKSMAGAAGQSADSMLGALKQASRGAVSDFDLMLNANRAMLLGVTSSADDMVDLMDVARARSQAMGTTTAAAFGDIVTGISRLSAQILDNQGISINAAAANEAYAQSIGSTAAALSEQEKRQAMLNAVIEGSRDIVAANVASGDDLASKYERMDASLQNAKSALGELFSPAIAAVASSIAVAATAVTAELQEIADNPPQQTAMEMALLSGHTAAAAHNADRFGSTFSAADGVLSSFVGWLKEGSAAYGAARGAAHGLDITTQEYTVSAGAADEATRGLSAATGMLNLSYGGLGMSAKQVARDIQEAGLMAELASDAFDRAVDRQRSNMASLQGIGSGLVDNLGAGGTQDWIGEQDAELKRLQQNWEKVDGYSEDYIQNVLTPAYLTTLRNGASELDRTRDAALKVSTAVPKISEEAKEAQRQFEALRSTVEGTLSAALSHNTGVDPDKILGDVFGFREDAINEQARRLADIAKNGLTGQDWLGDFQTDVPDIWNMIRMASDPQQEAAFLLRDFQDGLLTSAIDKGKAKEIIKRQMLGDASMAELALEIANELAGEMGMPLQNALGAARTALGVGGMVDTGMMAGADFGLGVMDAMGQDDQGRKVVDALTDSIRAQASRLRTAGQDSARTWGDGFMSVIGESIPPQLIEVLTTLITPSVMSKIQQQGSLTGATQ